MSTKELLRRLVRVHSLAWGTSAAPSHPIWPRNRVRSFSNVTKRWLWGQVAVNEVGVARTW